jgi:glycosyltransferase involved in cell wall biosynthesis
MPGANDGTPKPPGVSVVICVIDPHPVYFVEAVGSVLGQTFPDLELLIIEEPSSRDGRSLLAHVDDPRIRHRMHDTRTSLVEQRNRGLALARAELVAVLDADDIAEPGRLEAQIRYLDSHPEVGVLGTQLKLIDPRGATLGYRRYPIQAPDVARALRLFNPIGQPSIMLRKSAVEECGGYQYSSHPATEDYELWCRMAAQGVGLANLPEPLVRYRIHPGGMKTTRLRGILRGSIEIKQRYFRGRLGIAGYTRLLAERLLLRLPASWVMHLFLTSQARSTAGR